MERIFKIRASQAHTIMGNGKGGKLPATCTSYLKKWYANDADVELNTKEINKGNAVEDDTIDMCARVLGFGILSKNENSFETEYFTGTADVVTDDYVIDAKSPYCNRTFHNCINEENEAYNAQLQVYMFAYIKSKSILFYGLQDTPATDWSDAVSYSHIPENERWYAIEYAYDSEFINALIERVIECRAWLAEYDLQLQSKLGKLCKI
jgi:hypothetical protein